MTEPTEKASSISISFEGPADDPLEEKVERSESSLEATGVSKEGSHALGIDEDELEALRNLKAAGLDMSSNGSLVGLLLDGVREAGSAHAFIESLRNMGAVTVSGPLAAFIESLRNMGAVGLLLDGVREAGSAHAFIESLRNVGAVTVSGPLAALGRLTAAGIDLEEDGGFVDLILHSVQEAGSAHAYLSNLRAPSPSRSRSTSEGLDAALPERSGSLKKKVSIKEEPLQERRSSWQQGDGGQRGTNESLDSDDVGSPASPLASGRAATMMFPGDLDVAPFASVQGDSQKKLLRKAEKMGGVNKLLGILDSGDSHFLVASIELAKAAGIANGELADRDVALWKKIIKKVGESGGVLPFLKSFEGADPSKLARDLGFLRDARQVWKLKPEALSSMLEQVVRISTASGEAGVDVAEVLKGVDKDLLLQVMAASKAANGISNLLGLLKGVSSAEWPLAFSIIKGMAIELDKSTTPSQIHANLTDWESVVELAGLHGGVRSLLPKVKEVAGVAEIVPMLGVLRGAGLIGVKPAGDEEIERWQTACTSIFNCCEPEGGTAGVNLLLEATRGNQLAPILKIIPQLRDTDMLARPSSVSSASSSNDGGSDHGSLSMINATAHLEEIIDRVRDAGGAKAFLWTLRDANFRTIRDDLFVLANLKDKLSPSAWDLFADNEQMATLFDLVDSAGGFGAFIERYQSAIRRENSNRMTTLASPTSGKLNRATTVNTSPFASPTSRRTMQPGTDKQTNESPVGRKTTTERTRFRTTTQMAAFESEKGIEVQTSKDERRRSEDRGLPSPTSIDRSSTWHQGDETENEPAKSKASRPPALTAVRFDVNPLPETDMAKGGSTEDVSPSILNDTGAIFDVDPSALDSLAQLLKGSEDPLHDSDLITNLWHAAQETSGPERLIHLIELIDERFWSFQPEDHWHQVMKCLEMVHLRHVRMNELIRNQLRLQKVDDTSVEKIEHLLHNAGGAERFAQAMDSFDWPCGIKDAVTVLGALRCLANTTKEADWQALAAEAWQVGGLRDFLEMWHAMQHAQVSNTSSQTPNSLSYTGDWWRSRSSSSFGHLAKRGSMAMRGSIRSTTRASQVVCTTGMIARRRSSIAASHMLKASASDTKLPRMSATHQGTNGFSMRLPSPDALDSADLRVSLPKLTDLPRVTA